MCGGGDDKPVVAAKPKAPPVPQIVRDMMRATDFGPTGYTPAMRANLGMDIQMGGAKPVSGMTRFVPAGTGYKPVAAKPDPLIPILQALPPPKPVVKPVVKPTAKPAITNPALTTLLNGKPRAWVPGRNAR